MDTIKEKLRLLKLKSAHLFSDIESLSEVSESMFLQFGNTQAEILKLEKEFLRKTENNIQ